MSLSQETVARVDHFRRTEELYQPCEAVRRVIGEKVLGMFIGPAVIGKTTLMNRVAKIQPEYGRSATLSTRRPRPDDDPGTFRLLEHTDENIHGLLDKILDGSLVQYKFHPTELTFYGSEAEDHRHRYNMLATLSGGINQLESVGFKETHTFGLVAPPDDWSKRFDRRYTERHPLRLSRLEEAEISYHDLLLRANVQWIINREGSIDDAAHGVIKAGDAPENHEEALAYAHRILQLIETKKERTQSQKYE